MLQPASSLTRTSLRISIQYAFPILSLLDARHVGDRYALADVAETSTAK